MTIRILRLFALALALLALNAHARTAAMANFDNLPVTNSRGEPASPAQIKAAVIQGAAARSWTLTDIRNDRAIANIQVRGKHTVTTEVLWTAGQVSVKYKDSVNMNYSGNEIHPNYNAWVQNLVDSIRVAASKP
jgi:hypothetical protein